MHIAAEVRSVLHKKASGESNPPPKAVYQWMVSSDNSFHHETSLRDLGYAENEKVGDEHHGQIEAQAWMRPLVRLADEE